MVARMLLAKERIFFGFESVGLDDSLDDLFLFQFLLFSNYWSLSSGWWATYIAIYPSLPCLVHQYHVLSSLSTVSVILMSLHSGNCFLSLSFHWVLGVDWPVLLLLFECELDSRAFKRVVRAIICASFDSECFHLFYFIMLLDLVLASTIKASCVKVTISSQKSFFRWM